VIEHSGPKIYRTLDGGQSWRQDSVEGSGKINKLYCIDYENCFGIGDYGYVFRTNVPDSLMNNLDESSIPGPSPSLSITNPAYNNIHISNPSGHSFDFCLFDLLGRPLFTYPVATREARIKTDQLPPGLNLWQARNARGALIGNGKIVVQ